MFSDRNRFFYNNLRCRWARATCLLALMCVAFLSAAAQQPYKQLTNLTTMYIDTEGGAPVASRDDYVTCTVTLVNGDSVVQLEKVQIRGRGNSTWTDVGENGKRPYRLKLNKKRRLIGPDHANAKSWTLLANAADKSMLHNAITADVGRLCGLPFCPAAQFVDLYLNGDYRGTYQLSDQVEVRERRVEVDTQTGWLLEYNKDEAKSSPPQFKLGSYGVVDIKNPTDEQLTSERMNAIETFVNELVSRMEATDSLAGLPRYMHPVEGYRAMVDTASLVNWAVAGEITANWDMLYSVFLYKEADAAGLSFGPLWDLDLGYNNHQQMDMGRRLVGLTNIELGWLGSARPLVKLTERVWQDPWFQHAMATRLQQLIDSGIEAKLLACVDSLAALIDSSQQRNYEVWPLYESSFNYLDRQHSRRTYAQYVDLLRDFIPDRLAFLQRQFSSRDAHNRAIGEGESVSVEAADSVNIILRRPMEAEEWTTLCLPFSLSDAQSEALFGKHAHVAEPTAVEGNTLIFTTLASKDLQAGRPYLIRPTRRVASPTTIPQVSIIATEPSSLQLTDAEGRQWTFSGTFSPTDLNDTSCALTVSDHNFALSSEGRLPALRGVLQLPSGVKASRVRLMLDGSTSAIRLPAHQKKRDRAAYNLRGQRIKNASSDVPSGIYIEEGRKFVRLH